MPLRQSRLNAVYQGREYPLERDRQRWVLVSGADDAPGEEWQRIGHSWVLEVTPEKVERAFSSQYEGQYRGIDVVVSPCRNGSVLVTSTNEPAASAVGMRRIDKLLMGIELDPEDPDLTFHEVIRPLEMA